MDFSHTARYYHLLEGVFIGSALQRTRAGQLDRLEFNESSDRVLIVGEGNGRFLCALLNRYPKLSITVVDASAAMLKRARWRLESAGLSDASIIFKVADLRCLELPSRHYNLIVTNFFFSNFPQEDAGEMIRQLADAASMEAQWLEGDFVLPARGILRLRAKLCLWVLYRFFGWTAGVRAHELPEVESYFVRAGFRIFAEAFYCGRLLRSAAYQRA